MTSVVSIVCVGGFVAMIGLRPAPAPPPASGALSGDASDAGAAAMTAPWPARVSLRGRVVLLDGVEIARTDMIVDSGRMHKVDGLYSALKERRWDHPGEAPSVLLDVTQDTPAVVVKSVFQTALFAGVSDVKLVTAPAGAAAP